MNTFTLRQIPGPVERRIRLLAREAGKSLNKTTLELLEQAVGLGPVKMKTRKRRDVKSAVRQWTEAQYREFREATKAFDVVDEEMWRT